MGKGGKPKVEVTKYFQSDHFGICIGPVTLLAITVKEKPAWEGEEDALTSFVVDKDQLFGGPKKEGGFEGVVYWLPGANDQLLPDVLAQKLGRANGADAPGYRGIASAWITGPKGTAFASYGGWTESIKGRGGAYWSANSPYLPPIWFTVRRAPVGLNPDYALVPRSIHDAGEDIEGEVEVTWWQISEGGAANHQAQMGIEFLDADGDSIGGVSWATLANPLVWTERTHAATAPAGARQIRIYMQFFRSLALQSLACIDDIEVTLDGSPLTILNPGAELGTGAIVPALDWPENPGNPGWANDHGYIGTRTATPSPHSGDRAFSGGASGQARAYALVSFPAGAPFDANPAHIIYESLTNTDWGMGSSSTAIDVESFEAAGVTLYNELFGLSMIWTRQAAIQDFIQEVLDHINAVLFVDPGTGLLTLKLVRADYDPDALPDLNPSNADLANFSRKLLGELTSEIVVSWTNPDTEQEETAPPAQDLGLIAMQGLVSDSRNYYGVRYGALAQRLAWRELAIAGQPLATFEASVDRTQYLLRPASVVTVTWPEYGLAGVVCRVTSADYGRPGDPTIKLNLIEDVFGVDFGDYVDPPTTDWVDPSSPPQALTIEQIFTMPLYFAANSTVAEFVNDPVYPEVVAGVLATTDQEDAYGYNLWDEVTLPNGSLEWQELASRNIIGHAETVGALAAEVTSTGVTFDSFMGGTAPTVGGFVIIGDEGDTGNEIAMVDAVGSDYDLVRGVLDTVPRAWPAGTPVWFVDAETLLEYPDVVAAGETLDVKLLTTTSQGTLALTDAALVSQALNDRPWLPNRPANVEIGGVMFNTEDLPVDMIGETEVPCTWANRNRLTEDSQVLAWDDATVTPETDQFTKIEVRTADLSTVITTHDGLSGTSFAVPVASFGGEAVGAVQFWSERSDGDGDFTSLQGHVIWVQVALGELVSEDGDHILGEDSNVLISEG